MRLSMARVNLHFLTVGGDQPTWRSSKILTPTSLCQDKSVGLSPHFSMHNSLSAFSDSLKHWTHQQIVNVWRVWKYYIESWVLYKRERSTRVIFVETNYVYRSFLLTVSQTLRHRLPHDIIRVATRAGRRCSIYANVRFFVSVHCWLILPCCSF